MASTNDDKRTIVIKAQIVCVGDGAISLKKSIGGETFKLQATRDDEQWAAARLYHYVDIDVTIGPGR